MYSLDWPYVDDKPQATASFKLSPQDFHVNEFFDGVFTGEGEHIILKIEKTALTTEEVIKSLARLINKPVKLISYAGLKDRQALVTQYLSIHAPGEEINGISSLQAPGWRVMDMTRHNKKLRPGFLVGNRFMVRLKNVTDLTDLLKRIDCVKARGVPNYFGEQRFGRSAGNLIKAEELLVQGCKVKDRFLKGLYFSAARSWIFNLILAKRIQEQCWNIPLCGDVMKLSGSNSIFTIEAAEKNILQRIAAKDISPASPLAGKSSVLSTSSALKIVSGIYEEWKPWIEGLKRYGLEEAWRANILHVEEFDYLIKDQVVELSFMLPAGAYATAVLRELVRYT